MEIPRNFSTSSLFVVIKMAYRNWLNWIGHSHGHRVQNRYQIKTYYYAMVALVTSGYPWTIGDQLHGPRLRCEISGNNCSYSRLVPESSVIAAALQ